MQFKELFVTVPFRGSTTQAFVTEYGSDSKPQILCFHGIGSTGQESFQNVAPFLEQEYQLVVPDWVGFGKSSRFLGNADSYDARYCSDWLEGLITAMVTQRILRAPLHILAHSMSAIAVAYIYPAVEDLINKIIFVNPAGLDRKIHTSFAFVLTNSIINQRKIARWMVNNFFWKHILGWSEKHRERLMLGLNNGELEILVRYAKAGIKPWGTMKPSHVIPQKFSRITKPTMILSSSTDHVFYNRQYLMFAKEHQWQTKQIQYHDHNIITRKPQESADVIKEFLT